MLGEKDIGKKLAGEQAANEVQDGMKVGLGSGSTVYWMVKRLGERVQQGLKVEGIPSSNQTEQWAKEFGVPLTDFSQVDYLDVTIDGADEVDENLNLIKGGGGALFREKVIAEAAKKFVIIVDQSKVVTQLGAYPLPVEVLPFGWEMAAKSIEALGCAWKLRRRNNEIFVTDNGNYILDCDFGMIPNPEELHKQLKMIVGVVETGLFANMADKVIIGGQETTKTIEA